MERAAFDLLNQMERSWWYRARAAVVRAAIKNTGPTRVGRVLDFGAGFGGMHKTLSRYTDHIDAFEPDTEADRSARSRGYEHVFASEEEALQPDTYNLIGAFDVVEHIEQDRDFLQHAHNALKRDGRIIITVPAFPYLWSVHDVNHHHFRRYTKASMQKLLNSVGYDVIYTSYWNMCLSIPAVLMRALGRSGESALALPPWLDSVFYAVLSIERVMMRLISLPFGTSLVVVARKRTT